MRSLEKIITYGAALLLISLIAFVAGYGYRHKMVWPTPDLITLNTQYNFYQIHGVWARSGQHMPARVSADQPRMDIQQPDQVYPGYRILMGHDADIDAYSARLFDAAGNKIHTWPLDYDALLGQERTMRGQDNPHGMDVFPDGSLVLAYGGEATALARIDSCGAPMWIEMGRYHHSAKIDENGTIWTWLNEEPQDAGHLENIVQIDAETGETLRTINLPEVALATEKNKIMMGIYDGFRFGPKNTHPRGVYNDIFHANDVEPLPTALADAFPMFEPGDLLISLRELNLVAVLDPDTKEIKWGSNGPWIRQHDPDFTDEGLIDVYNNNTGRGRSDILTIDPATNEVTRRLGDNKPPYYSGPQGKQQRLPNGSYLITVPGEGRVLEVAEDGSVIFEFNNITQDGLNGRMLHAIWVPEDFFETVPSCGN